MALLISNNKTSYLCYDLKTAEIGSFAFDLENPNKFGMIMSEGTF